MRRTMYRPENRRPAIAIAKAISPLALRLNEISLDRPIRILGLVLLALFLCA